MESITDLLLLPLLLTFFGALIYGLSVDNGLKRGKLAPSRWVGVGLVVLGLLAGFRDFWALTDSFNRSAYQAVGKRVYIAHYLAGLLPLIALLVCLGVDFWARGRLKGRNLDDFDDDLDLGRKRKARRA